MRLEDSTSGFHTALFAVRIGNDHFTRIEDEDEVREHTLNAPSSASYATILTDIVYVPPISPRPHCVSKIYFSIVYAVLISVRTTANTCRVLLGDIIRCAGRIGKLSWGF